VEPLSEGEARKLLDELSGWELEPGGRSIRRMFGFSDHHRVMAFVNAVAWISHGEDHHPDMEVGYNRCVVRYTTHAIDGLSENDFICASKVDGLLPDR
jgi:4a-hydroxytetrahydrobiopterin dehydratase